MEHPPSPTCFLALNFSFNCLSFKFAMFQGYSLKQFLNLWTGFLINCTAYYSSFRINFILTFFVDIFFYSSMILMVYYLFDHLSVIGPYNKDTFLFFVLFAITVQCLDSSLISAGYWHLPEFIRTGELDFLLTKPFPSLFVVFTNFIMTPMLITLPIWVGLLIVMGVNVHFSVLQWLFLPFLILFSTILTTVLQILISLTCFWTIQGRGVNLSRNQILSIGRWPEFIYSQKIKQFFYFIPILLIISPSVYFLLDFSKWPFLVLALLTLLLLGGLLRFLWPLALSRYESASS